MRRTDPSTAGSNFSSSGATKGCASIRSCLGVALRARAIWRIRWEAATRLLASITLVITLSQCPVNFISAAVQVYNVFQ